MLASLLEWRWKEEKVISRKQPIRLKNDRQLREGTVLKQVAVVTQYHAMNGILISALGVQTSTGSKAARLEGTRGKPEQAWVPDEMQGMRERLRAAHEDAVSRRPPDWRWRDAVG